MAKLLLHIVVAFVLISIGRAQEWRWWLTTLAVVAGLFVVHFVFELLFSGTPHLGAAAISNDNPLMVEALAEAKRTWDRFTELYEEHRDSSIVKFRLPTESGEVENVWGDLLELGEEQASLKLLTPPVGRVEIPADRRLTTPISEIVDWQIVLPDDTLLGGFTQRATFEIMKRAQGSLPRKFETELARYRDLEDSAPGGMTVGPRSGAQSDPANHDH